ncbi:MAG TPA: isochorismatase family protein [Polyangiaceae bacterium]|nr:isochorismatase family protein [Polyangiaceae bacterium]
MKTITHRSKLPLADLFDVDLSTPGPRVEGGRAMSPWILRSLVASFAFSGLLGCFGNSSRGARATPPVAARATTLRVLYGLKPPTEVVPAHTALVLVDFQDEFVHGRLPVADPARAIAHAADLVRWARANGLLVVHVRNVSSRPESPIFAPSSPTIEIVPELRPAADGREQIVTKSSGGAFTKTGLDTLLRSAGIDTLVVAGIMTQLAVDSSARDATVLGYHVVVASDACTTRPLRDIDGGIVDAVTVQRVALAALADRFADVMPTSKIIGLPLARVVASSTAAR